MESRPTEIAPGILRLDLPLGERRNSVYAVIGSQQTLLYDAGIDGSAPAVHAMLRAAGVADEAVTTAVISHADVDHFGGIAGLRETFSGVRILAHQDDAPLIEDYRVYESERARGFRDYGLDEDPAVLDWARQVTRTTTVDTRLSGSESINLGDREVEIRHVPGHSAGSVAVWVPDVAVALISDAVLGVAVPLVDGSPAFPPTYRYPSDYLQTIQEISGWPAKMLATAHYGCFAGDDIDRFLQQSRHFVDRVGEELELSLQSEPGTLAELADRLSPRLGSWPTAGSTVAMAFPVTGHLEELRRAGRVDCDSRHRWSLRC